MDYDDRSRNLGTPDPSRPTEPHDHRYDKYKAQRELNEVVGASHEVLVKATTVFPFTLFPDAVTVDRSSLIVVKRTFFNIAEVIRIRIEDILNVTADVGPFFGSLQIATRFYDIKKPYTVNWLWRHDALRIQRIMQGYIVATQKEVDTSALSTKELAHMLDELGKGAPAA